jgi:ABC-type nitrate/sulfonate/bicarbonate transport system permease component
VQVSTTTRPSFAKHGLDWLGLLQRATGFRSLFLAVISFCVGLLLWELLSLAFNPFLIPPPLDVFRTALPMIKSGEIFKHTQISLVRVAVGFISGSALAIAVGVPMGRLKLVHDLLDPTIELLRYLSPTAMIPIAVIWFGIGELAKYFLIFWGTFFIVLLNTAAGVARTPVARQRAAECLGASNLQVFLLVIIPSAIPHIVIGMRVAMASSFMSIIPAEMLAADSGLGYLLQTSGLLLQTDRIFVALATISVIGFLTDRAFRWAVNRLLSRYMERLTIA